MVEMQRLTRASSSSLFAFLLCFDFPVSIATGQPDEDRAAPTLMPVSGEGETEAAEPATQPSAEPTTQPSSEEPPSEGSDEETEPAGEIDGEAEPDNAPTGILELLPPTTTTESDTPETGSSDQTEPAVDDPAPAEVLPDSAPEVEETPPVEPTDEPTPETPPSPVETPVLDEPVQTPEVEEPPSDPPATPEIEVPSTQPVDFESMMREPSPPTDEEILEGLRLRGDGLATLATQVQAVPFEVRFLSIGHVAAAAGSRRPRALLDFVRENFRFEPYNGAVRGARGVLFSRSGNSADLSLLLAGLLDEAGMPWRMVRGTLDAEQTQLLLTTTAPSGEYRISDETYSALEDEAPRHRRGFEHWWIEANVRGDWLALDPSFPALRAGTAATEAEEVFGQGELPSPLNHTVLIRLRYRPPRRGTETALELETNLTDLTFRNLVLSFTAPDRRNIRARLSAASFEQESGLIALRDADQIWLDFEVTIGEHVRTVRKEIRNSGEGLDFFGSGVQVYSILFLPGWVGPDYHTAVAGGLVESISQQGRTLIEGVLLEEGTPRFRHSDSQPLVELLGPAAGLVGLTFALYSDQIGLALAPRFGVTAFYGWPRVLVVGALVSPEGLAVQLDLLEDGIETLPFTGVPGRSATGFQALRGRLNSHLSGAVVGRLTSLPTLSASNVLNQCWSEGRSFISASPTQHRQLSRVQAPRTVTDRIADDAREEGAVVLVPSRRIDVGSTERLAWWQMESATGRLAGVLDDGTRDAEAGLFVRIPETEQNLLWLHQTLSLAESLAATVVEREPPVPVSDDLCFMVCDLERVADSVCGDPLNGDLGRCLGSTELSDDPLGLGLSCGEMVDNFRCGATISRAVVEGRATVEVPDDDLFWGPWPESLSLFEPRRCHCPD